MHNLTHHFVQISSALYISSKSHFTNIFFTTHFAINRIWKEKNEKKNNKKNRFRFILSTPPSSLYCETASQICRKFSSNCCSLFVVTQNNNNLWSIFSHGEFPVEVRSRLKIKKNLVSNMTLVQIILSFVFLHSLVVLYQGNIFILRFFSS